MLKPPPITEMKNPDKIEERRQISWTNVKKNMVLAEDLTDLIKKGKDQEALHIYEQRTTLAQADLIFLLRTDKSLTNPSKTDYQVLHEVIFQTTSPKSAGKFRTCAVFIQPGATLTCDPHRIELELDTLELQTKESLAKAKTLQEKLAVAAFHHARFEAIHPFQDGNGRCGRIALQAMMEAILQKKVPLNTHIAKNKDAYIGAISHASKKEDLSPLTSLLCQAAGIPKPSYPIPSPWRIRPQMRDIPISNQKEIIQSELNRSRKTNNHPQISKPKTNPEPEMAMA